MAWQALGSREAFGLTYLEVGGEQLCSRERVNALT